MRISLILIIFLILFNGWGGLIQQYDLDEHVGINAETGDAKELEQASENAESVQSGEPIGETLIGFYNSLGSSFTDIMVGWQPGVQLLINIAPPGPAEDLIEWAFSIMNIIIFADVAAFFRGVDI